MRYVLDSNVGAKWVLAEDLSDKADAFRAGAVAGVHELIAPDAYPIEVAQRTRPFEDSSKGENPTASRLNPCRAAGTVEFAWGPRSAA